MKVLFLGTPDFAVASLKAIMESQHEVCGVITSPDKPAGRGQKLRQSAVKKFALENNLLCLQPQKLKGKKFLEKVRSLKPDVAVVVAFRMMPKLLWSIPRLGTFNLHASLLPDYRGAAPINWAIINGETESGVTTFLIDEKIDTGNILLQKRIEVKKGWTAGELHDKLMTIGADLVCTTLHGLAEEEISPKPQKEKTNYQAAPKLDKDICRINWDCIDTKVIQHILGLSPYPTSWTTEGGKPLKIFNAQKSDSQTPKLDPGSWVIDEDKKWVVGTKTRNIELTELQLSGKKRMKVSDFINGFRQTGGKFE